MRRAFALLELLLVLVVIAALVGGYFTVSGNSASEQSVYQATMSRSKNTACKANRTVLQSNITMFKVAHPGEEATLENMAKAGINLPKCPEGGTYTIGPNETIVCDKHTDE